MDTEQSDKIIGKLDEVTANIKKLKTSKRLDDLNLKLNEIETTDKEILEELIKLNQNFENLTAAIWKTLN